jgi:hypothetical protein
MMHVVFFEKCGEITNSVKDSYFGGTRNIIVKL